MTKRKRASKEHVERLRRICTEKQVEKEKNFYNFSENLEINGSSKISLNFNFNNVLGYHSYLEFFENSVYFKKAIELYAGWKSQNNWRSIAAEKRKINFLCLVANLLLLPRICSGQKLNQPLSLNIAENKHLYEVVHFFRDNNYINFLPGCSFENKDSETSKILPTAQFDAIFPAMYDDFECIRHITFSDSQLVRIKRDGKHVVLSATNASRTKELANKLIKINRVNLSHKIVVRISGSEYSCCTKLYAVFNRNLNLGGRLYASQYNYQNDLRKNRSSIFIDDEPTIELDFSGLHPRMLYAEKGIQFDDDLYSLSGILPEYDQDQRLRKLSKFALLILINSKNNKNTAGALFKYIQENNKKLHRHLERNYKKPNDGDGIYKRTVESLIKKHSKISEFFHTGVGTQLQNRDGKMALWICFSFAQKEIPILPVHDSFIVAKQYEKLLKNKMIEGYGKFNKGFVCPIH